MKKPRASKQAKPTPAHEAETENCGACQFWRGERCRRFPPEKKAGEHMAMHLTVTAATDWCGEFRRVG